MIPPYLLEKELNCGLVAVRLLWQAGKEEGCGDPGGAWGMEAM